ncbi:MAG: DNA-directed RNA polymerase subunit alpha [Planctomycetes bacterium]|nr:DNA-directed RNA polymerase subunit alpha [Planctomycetota bacterium]
MRIRWRNLELPSRVVVERDSLTPTYGRFIIEPFERGFGHTIGNGLRRVLLSSLEGTAVQWFTISGALHEFQAVEGVVEDVTEIVLQLKQLLVKIPGEGPVTLRVDKKTKGPISAGDITCEGDAEIVNKDLHICTLTKSMAFEMRMEAARGRGYVTAEENEQGGGRHSDAGARRGQRDVEQEIGKIWVDSIFSPVLRVRYGTQDTRVGKLTDYDKLILEIWSDGTLRPEEALAEASKIYRKFLNPLCAYGSPGSEIPAADPMEEEEIIEPGPDRTMLDKSIAEMDLSVRSSNCLEAEKIFTVGDLVSRSEAELMAVRNFGKTSLEEILAKLEEMGLELAPN